MVKLFFKVIFFLLSSTSIIVVAQQKNYPDISPPLKLPITLAGTFCELRNSHFHGGIDLRTNGEVGHKIYAVETGFVSRIRISGSATCARGGIADALTEVQRTAQPIFASHGATGPSSCGNAQPRHKHQRIGN